MSACTADDFPLSLLHTVMPQIDQNNSVQDKIDTLDIPTPDGDPSALAAATDDETEMLQNKAFQADDEEREADKSVIQHSASTEDEDRKIRAESYKIMASLGNIGIFLLLAVLFTYFIGKWCDDLFGTKPVFTVIWIVLGVAATIKEAVQNIRAASRLGEDKSQTKEVTK